MARDTKYGILITGDASGAVQAINLTTKEVEQLDNVTTKTAAKVRKETDGMDRSFSSTAKTAAQFGAAIAATGVALGGLALRKMIKETSESDAVMAQLNATLAATGGASGKTAAELEKTAKSLQSVTTFSDEAVIGVQDVLLKFKDVKGDTFDRATKSILDMATAMKMDASSAAKLVGKALEEPEKGLARLARSGVTFTEAQKDTIKAMVEMGDKAGAQNIILQAMEERFKGSAEAARVTLGGALEALKIKFDDLFELDTQSSDKITQSINDLNVAISDPKFKEGIDNLVTGLISVVTYSAQALGGLTKLGQYLGDFAATAREDVDGTAEGIARLSQELETAKQRLDKFNSEGGNKETLAYKSLVSNIDRLNAAVALSEIAYNKSKGAADKYIDSIYKGAKATTTAETAQNKFTLVVNKTAAATKSNTAATVAGTGASLKSADTLEKERKEEEKRAAAKEKTRHSIAKLVEAEVAATKKIEDYIAGLSFEQAQLGRTAREQAQYNAVKEFSGDLSEENKRRIMEEAGALYDKQTALQETARAEEEAARISEQAWSHLTDSLSDIFTLMVVEGKSAFDTINDGFSAMIKKMVAEAAVNEIIIGFGGTTASGQNSQNSTFTNRATNAAMTYGISELLSSAFTAFTGDKEQIKDDPLAKTINKLADASFKPIEWITGKSFSDVFGQKNDGSNRGFADFDLATGTVTSRGSGKTFDPANVDMAEQLATALKDFSDAIGGSTLKANISVGGKSGIQFGGQSFGSDAGAFLQQAFKDVIKSATNLSDKIKPLIIGFDGTAEEIATFAATLSAIDEQTDGINDQLITLIGNFEGTAQELIRFSAAIASIQQQADINTVTRAIEDFTKVVPTASEAYRTHTADLKDQIRAYDGTATSAEKLATTLAENKTAAYEFALAIQSIGKSIKEVAEDQAKSIRESVLTADQLLKKRIAERDSLNNILSQLSDPEAVSKTAQRILELNQQVFDSLTEDQQKSQAETFAKFAENTNTVAQSILQQSLDGLKITQDDINARVSQMLQQAAQSQQRAADTQLQAANAAQQAANTLVQAANTMNNAAAVNALNVTSREAAL